ncbi:hypothetical protein V5E97_28595 [Singulisphaera sp. Ch08]|uniref:Lipoprotein n=1 Tax=Singulisphaera sp. Ch08 TaxID=3120278 RepID=A0AAU7CAK6_9BACT
MSSRSGPTGWQWLKLGSCLLVVGGLFIGCSKEEEGGTAEFRQKFEQPAVAPPTPKEKPTPYKDMSPREKKALKQEGKEG